MNDQTAPQKIIYVYVLTDPRYPDKVRYVGVTEHPKKRLRDHISLARRGKKTHRADWINSLLRDGVTPVMTEIDQTNSEEWQQCEIAWIAYYREMGCKLVNSTDGGEGLRNPSDEARKNISLAGLNKPPVSDETRRRLSVANRNRSEECRNNVLKKTQKPVLQYDSFGHFIRRWDSISDASRGLSIKNANIGQCCRRDLYRKSAGGFIWRYADDPLLGEYPTQLKIDFDE